MQANSIVMTSSHLECETVKPDAFHELTNNNLDRTSNLCLANIHSKSSQTRNGSVDCQSENKALTLDNVRLERLVTFFEEATFKSHATRKALVSSSGNKVIVDTPASADNKKRSPQRKDGLFPESTSHFISTLALLGGTPITLDTAMALRQIVSGSTVQSFSPGWKRSSFYFQNIKGPFPYGLVVQHNGSNAVVLAVQAYVLRYLLFPENAELDSFHVGSLKPSPWKRRQSLISAICTMLWKAGERSVCYVCLPGDEACFTTSLFYRPDGITEKLHTFKFYSYESVHHFMKRHITYFEADNNGCILFLYSLVLSRTVKRIQDDMGMEEDSKEKLLTNTEDCSPALLNLMLTGCAVKYLFNGDTLYDDKGKPLLDPLRGIAARSDIGFLFWNKAEAKDNRTQVGSMLRTPRFPIWLSLVNGILRLLFSINSDLTSDWRTEHQFVLHYYTGLPSQPVETMLSIDTRCGQKIHGRTSLARRDEEKKQPPLEQCIRTKWYGAQINWNGTVPFI